MVTVLQRELCVMGNAMKGLKNVVSTLAYLLIKYIIIELVTRNVIPNTFMKETFGIAMVVAKA